MNQSLKFINVVLPIIVSCFNFPKLSTKKLEVNSVLKALQVFFVRKTTLKNKKELATVNRKNHAEHPTRNVSWNTIVPRVN